MEENEKPFGCMAEGCNMRFTNEDHLTVHKKKHDMILNLGNGQKMNVFVADQTPTPTRFIRNCEEVGLFQDLQNVNPFEETFRKAVEAGKTGLQLHEVDSLQVPVGGDDTLHTPHVFPFPHMNDEPSHYKSSSLSQDNSKQKHKCSDDSLLRSGSSDSDEPMQTSELYNGSSSSNSSLSIPVPNINSSGHTSHNGLDKSDEENIDKGKGTVNVAGKSMQLYLRMPDGKLLQLVQEKPVKTIPTTSTSTSVTSPENGLALAKMKLKQALKKNGRIPSVDQEQEPKAAATSVDVITTSALPNNRTQQKSGSACASGSGEDDDEKKLKFRERNRAAAMRCREKRKTWVQELERRAEQMQKTNQQLQNEVTSLRAEVAQLKTLLLAHKNCPITQAMNQGHISTLPITTLQGNLLPLSHAAKRPLESTHKIAPQKSIMVLKKPPKIRKTSARVSTTSVSKPDTLPPAPSSSTLQKKPTWHKPQKIIIEPVNGNIPTVPVHSGNVSVQSVVVANPVVTTQALSTQPQLLVPFALSTIHPPPLVTFSHAAASATNENNLNLERMMNNKSNFDDDDVMEVPVADTASTVRINGSESKVIKVNPNAVRYNCNRRQANGRNKKNTAQSNTNVDPLSLDMGCSGAESSDKSRKDR